MIKIIQKKLRKILEVRIEVIRTFHQTNLNYIQLSQLFKENSFIPLTYSSLSPDVILHILNDIVVNKRKSIIEFGSGASTLYIAKLLKTHGLDEVNFFTVESNKGWIEEIRKQLKFYDLQDKVQIIHASIVEVPSILSHPKQKTWYDSRELRKYIEDKLIFDLVVVDGPMGAGSPYARYSAVPFLEGNLATEFSIFLDDTKRSDEEEIVKQWQTILGCRMKKYKRYSVLSSSNQFISLPFQLEV